ncbi:ABC transporter substrate-binding protein [Aciditerrimonas ferrireducens]|uniref:ABC transporter substrate-binding protein n=1 Tax=Aciditerrimonas ferrireducens TaxID=667306 RepID=UPI0020068ECB|nr:extracellular solute-binding protein [Aciditerrimonas ferrireducens]MCK4176892.1 extracellular solute-binding protein [Aciditerrimonas ferrireducens]
MQRKGNGRLVRRLAAGAMVVAAGSGLAACSSGSSGSATADAASSSACWATATSVSQCGGMKALVAAAKAEGHLNAIALPPDWANYGSIMKGFEKKYGITVNDANPDGSSGEELAAIKSERGSSKEPDVVDIGPSFALQGQQEGLFAPFKVPTWSEIPADQKSAQGYWWDDYGGYIAIGYNAKDFPTPPTSFASLLQPEFKGAVCLDGNPESAGAAFAGVYAAALANGGSLSNIEPGIAYFKELAKKGNFVPTGASPSTIASGQCRVTIDWTYLQVQYRKSLAGKVDWKVFVPTKGLYAAYYVQAISRDAPDPAAARLWETYLFSPAGQNGWLQGDADPVELAALEQSGQVDQAALAQLPPVHGQVSFPTQAQLNAAEQVVLQQWPSV